MDTGCEVVVVVLSVDDFVDVSVLEELSVSFSDIDVVVVVVVCSLSSVVTAAVVVVVSLTASVSALLSDDVLFAHAVSNTDSSRMSIFLCI